MERAGLVVERDRAPEVDPAAVRQVGAARGGALLDDRRGERTLLAFPRGSSRARLEQGSLASRELATGWQLAIDAPNTRWTIEATLATLERPFVPCGVLWQGRKLAAAQWSFDEVSQVLRAVVSGSGELVARRSCS